MKALSVRAMDTIAEMTNGGEKTYFTTAEIAKRLGIEAWRVRRSLKSMAAAEFALVWSDGNDRWCLDPRLVKLLKYVKDIEELKDKA